MPKRQSSGSNPKKAAGNPSPARRIRELDRTLVSLLNERAATVAEQEKQRSKPLQISDRIEIDNKSIQAAVKTSRGPLSGDDLERILRQVTSSIRALDRTVRVAYLGPAFTYSHLAATRHFGGAVDLNPVGTIEAVFEEIDRDHADFGVVPLENSTDGRVADTLDMFVKMPLRTCGEVKLRINHCLLAKCARSEILEVHSKPQAMSQCRGWLGRHLPDAQLIEASSTTAAARLAFDRDGVAAIASREAGIANGLDVVDANIQDNTSNITRFAIIGREVPKRTGNDKTAFLFGIPHRPGALSAIMSIFKRNVLNMTWIESFPAPNSSEEYLFFVEAVGHETDPTVKNAIDALRKKTSRLDILGSYPRSEPVD